MHGDVFRRPDRMAVFAACLGTGYQVAIVTLAIIGWLMCVNDGSGGSNDGNTLNFGIAIYTLTAVLNGYFSARFFAENGGKRWWRGALLSATLLPGCVSGVTAVVNSVAIYYQSSRAIPVGTLMIMLVLWAVVILPLTLLGATLGRRSVGTSRKLSFPTRINPIPRPVPDKLWW